MDGRRIVTDIDDDEKVVFFDQWGKRKKITGTRMGAIMGVSRFQTPFKVALEIARIYPGDPPNKYIEAGNILEPIIRTYVRKHPEVIAGLLGCDTSQVSVEEPVPADMCGYDHFHNNDVFGGLVDGYINVDGRHTAILEIKTASSRDRWLDQEGNVSVAPPDYLLQAGLYAELSGLDEIIFAVGFLEEDDYQRPSFWVPSESNCYLVHVKKPDMSAPMTEAMEWYRTYIEKGETPEWTDQDEELVKWLKSYDPKKDMAGGSKKGGYGQRKRRFRSAH